MAKLWYRTKTEDGISQLHEIAPHHAKITAPTLIYISGFMTVDSQPGFIAGGIKTMEELLLDQPELTTKPQIWAWSHNSLANIFNLAVYNAFPETRYCHAAEKFAAAIILPLVSDNGKMIDEAEARKRLSNLTLFGYSAGTILAQEAFNAATVAMKKMGYSDQTSKNLLQEIVLISTGTISRPTIEAKRYTTLFMLASNDIVIRWKNRIWSPLRNLFAHYAKPLTIRTLSDSSLLITAAVNKKLWEWRETSEGELERKKINPLLPKWAFVRSKHELPHYITRDDEHSQFAKIALYALIHAINRNSKISPVTLLQPPNGDNAAYQEKINKAFKG